MKCFVAALFTALIILASPGVALASSQVLENTGVQAISSKVGDVLLNKDWGYHASAVERPAQLDVEHAPIKVSLPHTWNVSDPTDTVPGYRRDASWYRKLIRIEPLNEARRYLLYFESANMTADVYINGQRAGGHIGGYLGFEIDITELVEFDEVNEILVRVDNGIDRHIIPSQKSDFVLYGGLTRDVFLRVRPGSYIASFSVDTPDVTRESATAAVSVEVHTDASDDGPFRLVSQVIDPQGQVVASADIDAGVLAGHGVVNVVLPAIDNPALWSPRNPALHTLRLSLLNGQGDEVHQQFGHFGFRWFSFAQDGSFQLNGERLLLRGTHRHEEFAGFGAAMPNELHVRDMEMIKEVGANFVRLAHYPQDPVIYDAADRLGLILWDELPWCRGGIGDDTWKRNTESMLREMITQNRNHPSVFFWSLGNEIYWEPDFEGGGDEAKLNEYLQHLNDIAHEMDPSRLTSIRKYYAGSDIVDVFSPSIWAGWYGGGYHQYRDALLDAQEKYPRLLHMEYGGSSHVGRSSWDPPGGDGLEGGQASVAEMVNQTGVISVAKGGDWSESYIVDLFDWHLMVSESLPGFAGNAQWAFKDFSTPLRPENPLPYINQKGLVDRQGRPKEAWWVFRSYWTRDPAFCHIYGHNWKERHGKAGDPQRIRVYCNTDTAQLSLNDVVLEEKTRDATSFPASGLYWDVQLEEGMNNLSVTGRSASGIEVSDVLDIRFTGQKYGKLANIELSSQRLDDGLIRIEAVAVDKNGRRVHSSRERVYFSHVNTGTGGVLLESFGTPDRSAVIELANGRAAILFDPSNDGGKAVIEVRSQTFKGSSIRVP